MNITLRALNRFGMGARIGEGPALPEARAWLRAQLRAPATADTVGGADLEELGGVLAELREAQRARDQERLTAVRAELRDLQLREAAMMLTARVRSESPFVERLVAFWSNHLCVSAAAGPQVGVLAGHYERRVIRPHVLGRFDDMVLASARHPAMLFYLDNAQSIGPGSAVGRRTARRGRGRGLNENYARELLELHTLGVDGGYGQPDVEALARILTGWSVAGLGPGGRAGETLGFVFRPAMHEPGPKTVLGKRLGEGGEREGEEAVRALCAHPATARHVGRKLAVHFVSDDPPPAAVEAIASRFRETGGDLRSVAETLVDLEEVWSAEHRKFRTPQDWLVAVLRAFRAEEAPPQAAAVLRQLRHAPWAPPAPKGYGELRREWSDPEALMNRAELARSLAQRIVPRRGFDPQALLEVVEVAAGDPLVDVIRDRTVSVRDRVALALGGPSFQWR